MIFRFFQRPLAKKIDLAAPAVARDPFPHYEELRRRGPVQYLARHGAWIVLGYDEVQSAFAQPQVFSNRPYAEVDDVLLAADPPGHTPVRRIVMRYFAQDAVQRLSAFAEEKAESLLQPRMDAVADYAVALSEAVAAQLLGLSDDALAAIRSAPREVSLLVRALDQIADRAAIHESLLADGLDDTRARSLVRLLWLAATTTTQRVIAHCVLHLLDGGRGFSPPPSGVGGVPPPRPGGGLKPRPTLDVPAFVDEVLRLHPPELLVPRMTTQAVTLGGAAIPANAVVHLCLAAANRDPAKFDAPAELRLDRPPMRHFTFGSGIHHCVGATLGRRVVEASVRVLLARAPRLRAAQPLENLVGWCSMTASPVERLLIEGAR
ncbi:MAG TPA: cytochrome P450 [Thermoanaerobaculia bacterium]